MQCSLVRDYSFEAAHRLPNVPEGHKCARMHGHSYRVSVVLAGEVDPHRGWLMDFAEIDEQVGPVIRRVDHQVLNEIAGLENPTSELFAIWLWAELRPRLPQLVELSVAETASSRCIYRGEPAAQGALR